MNPKFPSGRSNYSWRILSMIGHVRSRLICTSMFQSPMRSIFDATKLKSSFQESRFLLNFYLQAKINLFDVFNRSPTPNRRTILLLPKINRLYTRISTHLSRRSNFDHFCTILTRAFSADFSCDKFWQWCADWSSSFLCDFGVFDFVVHFRIFHKLLVFD